MMATPCAFSPADDGQQPGALGEAEAGGGFVHDDNAGIDRERLGDLDQLALCDRQFRHVGVGGEIGAETGQQRGHAAMLGGVVHQAQRAAEQPLAPDEHVGSDIEVLEQVEFLMHEGDAGAGRLGDAQFRMVRAVDHYRAGAGRGDAAEYLHQRGLAGAVLADEAEHLAGANREPDIVERGHAGIVFGDPAQFEHCHLAGASRVRDDYFASNCFIVPTNSATLDLSMTRVGTMIAPLAGMNDLSPFNTRSRSIID